MLKRTLFRLVFILVLAFFAGNFAFPKYFNQGIDFLNARLNWQLPKFWEVPFKLGLDLEGGSQLVYEADLSNVEKEDYSQAMQGLRDVIERRINIFGVTEPTIQVQENPPHYRLIVELAGIEDINEAIKMLGETPFLEFREAKENYREIIESNQKVSETGEGEYQDPFQYTGLTGQYLKKSEINFDQNTNKPIILLYFNDEGSGIFQELTKRNIGKPLPIYIDGIPISSPIVQDEISGGRAQITGDFTIDSARELVRNLNAGALPVPIQLMSQKTVGPILGEISLKKSLEAGVIGFLAIFLFLIIFYRIPGFFASLSLLIYISLLMSLFKIIPVTLTLAGIAGFLLSMGMAVDANILIFSRLREELKEGKSYSVAISEGSRRAWPSIRDGNFTTILVALVLFVLGTGFIKGFALTLIIGNLIGMFTAIFITNNFLKFFSKEKSQKWVWLWR